MNAPKIIHTLSKTARIFKAVASDFISDNTEMLNCYFTVPKDFSGLWYSSQICVERCPEKWKYYDLGEKTCSNTLDVIIQ